MRASCIWEFLKSNSSDYRSVVVQEWAILATLSTYERVRELSQGQLTPIECFQGWNKGQSQCFRAMALTLNVRESFLCRSKALSTKCAVSFNENNNSLSLYSIIFLYIEKRHVFIKIKFFWSSYLKTSFVLRPLLEIWLKSALKKITTVFHKIKTMW